MIHVSEDRARVGARTWLAAAGLIVALGLPDATGAADGDTVRGYLHLRLGGALQFDTDVRPSMESTRAEQLLGVSLGVNLSRHFGVELAGDGYELNLRVRGLPRGNTVGEYAVYTVVPQLRVRYPLLGGRLTPYALGGVGVGVNEFNDEKEPVFDFDLDVGGESVAVVATLGTGIEYSVADNIAIGLETKYLLSRGHEIRLSGREGTANLDSFLFAVGLRIFFP